MIIQNSAGKKKLSRHLERSVLGIVTLILLILFFRLYINLQPDLSLAEEGYRNGSVVNLAPALAPQKVKSILTGGNYYPDNSDATFISQQIAEGIIKNGPISNLGELNKSSMMVLPEQAIANGGTEVVAAAKASYINLGIDSAFGVNSKAAAKTPSEVNKANGYFLSATVKDHATDSPQEGIVVKLTRYFPHNWKDDNSPATDSVVLKDGWYQVYNDQHLIESYRYGITGEKGKAVFDSLAQNGNYSLLPVKKGFEFGASKGVVTLTKSTDLKFSARPHLIKLLRIGAYLQLKEDKVLTVRTPAVFKTAFFSYLAAFIAIFWLIHMVWSVKQFKGDNLILPVIMLLSGISVLMMYAIQDPLRDTMHGNDMVQGVIVGMCFLFALSWLNIGKIYTSKYFDIIGSRFSKNTVNQPGYIFIALAGLLILAVGVFGYGPDGSDVKVNINLLGLAIQPSEITKYLVIIFFAAYFTRNAKYLRSIPDLSWRLKNSLLIFSLFGALLLGYLLLGDMGPALVLCITFLIFYTIVRNELPEMIAALTLYSLLLVGASKIPHNSMLVYVVASVIYLVVWGAYWLVRKRINESPILIAIVMAAFVFGPAIPKVGERLKERNAIFSSKWDNETYGGDQIAQGIWALSGGGATGQGLGLGHPNEIPASHTDMILASIGEDIGLFGLIAVFICVGIILHRSVLIARRNAHPFVFYLVGGIAIVTGTQFFIIASGSLGTLPLTGVAVPFLSYGKVSMIVNLAALGLVMAASATEGVAIQQEAIQKGYDNTIALGCWSYTVGIIKIIAVLFFYQVFNRTEYITKPAFVVARNGQRTFIYNPRITLLIRKLKAGNIYDRNGLLLATSNKQEMSDQRDKLINAGLLSEDVDRQLQKKQTRYYPFEEQMFFWVGDYNTRLLWTSTDRGYFAENRYLTALRGFRTLNKGDNNKIDSPSHAYKEGRFLPPIIKTFSATKYNYSELAPLLKAGLNSDEVRSFNAINKDIQLTVDARLQTKLQNALAKDDTARKYRTSIVAINGATGEVLASALNPLPNAKTIKQVIERNDQVKIMNRGIFNGENFTDRDLGTTLPTFPGSTAKIMTALAAFNKLGIKARDIDYNITSDERIHAGVEPDGPVNMERAIVESSNVYFIKLANDNRLDNEMSDIYLTVGMSINGLGGYRFYPEPDQRIDSARKNWQDSIFNIKDRDKYYSKRKFRYPRDRWRTAFSDLAWGQGQLSTPLALARVAGTIGNNGTFKSSRFVLRNNNGEPLEDNTSRKLAKDQVYAATITTFMKHEAKRRNFDIEIAGKSGTPERQVGGKNGHEIDDAWYVFFSKQPASGDPIVVCIRMELAHGSPKAVALAKKVISVLQDKDLAYFPKKNSINQ